MGPDLRKTSSKSLCFRLRSRSKARDSTPQRDGSTVFFESVQPNTWFSVSAAIGDTGIAKTGSTRNDESNLPGSRGHLPRQQELAVMMNIIYTATPFS